METLPVPLITLLCPEPQLPLVTHGWWGTWRIAGVRADIQWHSRRFLKQINTNKLSFAFSWTIIFHKYFLLYHILYSLAIYQKRLFWIGNIVLKIFRHFSFYSTPLWTVQTVQDQPFQMFTRRQANSWLYFRWVTKQVKQQGSPRFQDLYYMPLYGKLQVRFSFFSKDVICE